MPFHVHEIDAYWNDVGSLPEYLQGNLDALGGRGGRRAARGRCSSPIGGDAAQEAGEPGIDGRVLVGEGCELDAGARLDGPLVIGDGAAVAAGACVKHSVLLPGARGTRGGDRRWRRLRARGCARLIGRWRPGRRASSSSGGRAARAPRTRWRWCGRRWRAAGLDAEALDVREISTDADAEREEFVGSPTIRVDGHDVQPARRARRADAAASTGSRTGGSRHCRPATRCGRLSWTPSKEVTTDGSRDGDQGRASSHRRSSSRTPTGTVHTLPAAGEAPATVVVWTCNHCPYALGWHDRIVQAARDYEDRGVRFLAVNSNDAERYPHDSLDAMRERVEAEELAVSVPPRRKPGCREGMGRPGHPAPLRARRRPAGPLRGRRRRRPHGAGARGRRGSARRSTRFWRARNPRAPPRIPSGARSSGSNDAMTGRRRLVRVPASSANLGPATTFSPRPSTSTSSSR